MLWVSCPGQQRRSGRRRRLNRWRGVRWSGGVAEGFGDDRDWGEFGELVEGAESRGPGAEQLTEAVRRCPGLMWRPGEEPRNTQLLLGCEAVWSCLGLREFAPWLVEGSGRAISIGRESDGHHVVADSHVVPGEPAMFSVCCPKTRMRIAAARSRV